MEWPCAEDHVGHPADAVPLTQCSKSRKKNGLFVSVASVFQSVFILKGCVYRSVNGDIYAAIAGHS